MRLINADELKKNFQDELCKGIACAECSMQAEGFCRVERWIDIAPTIEAYTIEDLRDAFRDGQDNECSYHWGIRKAEPWYMKDEVEE